MDINEFFEKMTDLEPTPDQKKLLSSLLNMGIKKIIISAGRQTGKTLCSAVAVLYLVFEWDKPVKVLLVSAQDNILYLHLREIFKSHPEFEDKIINRGTYSLVPLKGFETTNGSLVHVRKATDGQVRGLPADIVLLDECASIKNDIVLTCMGNLSGEVSKFIVLSTPHKLTSLFVKWAAEPKKYGFTLHHWSGENCKWHNPEIESMKKKEYTREKFKIEVQGLAPSKAERAFFPSKHIDQCVKPFVEREGGPKSSIEVGLDWAFDPCATVISVIERVGSRVKLLFCKSWKKKPIEDIAPKIAKIINTYKPNIIKADANPPEYQGHVEKYTHYKINYLPGKMHKGAMMAQLQRNVRRHLLEIPENRLDILLQFRKYRKGKRTGDDLVDSIAFASYQPATLIVGKPKFTVWFKDKKIGG